jgi:hypothetical protein
MTPLPQPQPLSAYAAELTKRQLQDVLLFLSSEALEGKDDPLQGFTVEDRKAFMSRMAVAWPDIERVILHAMRKQTIDIARYAENDMQVFGGRGGVNMADVLLETFRAFRDEHQQNIKDQQAEPGGEPPVVPSVVEGR